jgi:hypothetical protein
VSTPKDSTASSKSPRSRPQAASSKFAYAALGHGAALHPAVEVLLQRRDGAEFPIRALVDSGADCSCFPEEFAVSLGIDLEQCQQSQVHTGNGLAVHYCASEPLRATIAEREVFLTASFGPIGVPVLGRDDFFAEFLVEVDHPRRVVSLTPHADLGSAR